MNGCLQAIWDEGPGKRFSKHGHYINLSKPNYEAVAGGFAKTPHGEIWSIPDSLRGLDGLFHAQGGACQIQNRKPSVGSTNWRLPADTPLASKEML